jgi:hypothetical protein
VNLTIRFSHPLYLVTFTSVILLIGWAIGARWGRSATAGVALFWAVVALLVHDFTMVLLAGIGGYKFARKMLKEREW